MKKLITTTAFLVFGTLFMTAQSTKKKDNTRTKEKPTNSTEMKMDTSVQPNGLNRTADTAVINNRSKMQDNPDRLQQNQTVPNNGTLQNPNTTIPNNNGTLQNPNTTQPNNSTTIPPLQPVSPTEPTRPNR